MITPCKDKGAMKVATAVAISVTRKADTASLASPQRGWSRLNSVSTPISVPSMAAVTRSAHPVLRIRPATEADANPKLKIVHGRA